MALYDDAKIMFLASGAAGQERKDSSKIYNVKPAPVISSTTEQDLSTYTVGGVTGAANSITVSGGVATFAGDGSEFTVLVKTLVFETNKKYRVDCTVDITSGAVKFQDGDSDENIGVATVSGKYAFYFTSGGTTDDRKLRIARRSPSTAFNFTVSDVSVSEVNALPVDFDISRDANLDATRVGPNGLIEKGRENLLLQSNSFDTTWTSVNVTVTGGQEGYDGSSDAWELKMTGAQDGNNEARVRQTGISTSDVCTYSVFAKAGNVNFIRLIGVVSGSTNPVAFFDLSGSGSVTSSTVSVAATSIESFGNGWFRVSLTHKGAANPITDVRINISDGDDDVHVPTGSFIYIQDSQLEAGLAATDVITTTSATATAGLKEDEPRFDYPLAGGAPSLLIEPQSENIQPISENFSAYGTDDASVTANADISPEGVKNAAKLVEDGGNSTHKMHPPTGDSFTSGTTYSISVFAKAAGRTQFKLQAGTTDTAPYNAVFNLTGESSPTTPTNNDEGTASMEYYGNGWYRCKIEGFEADATATTKTNFFLQSSGNASYDGDGTSGILFYGLQLEEGAFATSYIPTHNTAATRSADVLPEVTHGITLGTAVTVLLEARVFGGGGQISLLQLRVDDSNRFLFFTNNSSVGSTHDINVQHRESGANNTINKTGLTRGDIFKCIGRVDGTTFNLFVNGVKLATTETVTATDIYSKISLIRNGTTTDQSGHKTKSVVVWDSALTDAQCIDLTTL